MESQNKQNWKTVVQKDIGHADYKYNLSKVNAKFSAKTHKVILGLFGLLGIILIIVGYVIVEDHSELGLPCILIGGIVLVITIITSVVIRNNFLKTRKKFLADLNLKSYYAAALSEITDNKYNLSSLKKEFSSPVLNFVPRPGTNRADNVLNMISEQAKLSFGTITNRVVTQHKDSEDVTYTRYRYLTLTLPEHNELVATIQKSKSFLKVFKSKDNTDLESTEFEKMFAVDANDQILIRKLLTPKVLAAIVDKANNEGNAKLLPAIEFNRENITIRWPGFLVSSWIDPKGAIAEPKFSGKNKDIANTLCEKIILDINIFLDCLSWVDVFEVL